MSISPIVKQVEGFTVTGFCVRTQNQDEFNEKTAKIPSLWQQFYQSELRSNTPIFGVYSQYDSDANGYYTVTAGIQSKEAHPSLAAVHIKAGRYLVFQGTGPMPETVVETWKHVWTFFASDTMYQRNFISDFEVYHGPTQVEIYIGLK